MSRNKRGKLWSAVRASHIVIFPQEPDKYYTRLAKRKKERGSSGDRQTDREMYVKPYERDRNLMDIEAYRLHKQLYVYLSPVIVTVGVVGNLLSFIVLVQKPFRRVSTYCYLIVLAVADTIVLTAGLLPKWIEQVNQCRV